MIFSSFCAAIGGTGSLKLEISWFCKEITYITTVVVVVVIVIVVVRDIFVNFKFSCEHLARTGQKCVLVPFFFVPFTFSLTFPLTLPFCYLYLSFTFTFLFPLPSLTSTFTFLYLPLP